MTAPRFMSCRDPLADCRSSQRPQAPGYAGNNPASADAVLLNNVKDHGGTVLEPAAAANGRVRGRV